MIEKIIINILDNIVMVILCILIFILYIGWLFCYNKICEYRAFIYDRKLKDNFDSWNENNILRNKYAR
jgi:hypothetical protein